MIRLDSVTRTFRASSGPEVRALDGIDLEVAAGEFVTVAGPSGSGKSTLLFTIGGLSHPTSGAVRLGAIDVYGLTPTRRAALRLTEVGFVFQTFNLVPYLTCLENVVLPALLAGRARSEATAAAAEILERLGLSARAGHKPAQLSVGERQRVGIGRALVNRPSVVLADEPTGNLDPANAEAVVSLFKTLHSEGQTIVMVTHDPRLTSGLGRVLRLRAGRVEYAPSDRIERLAS